MEQPDSTTFHQQWDHRPRSRTGSVKSHNSAILNEHRTKMETAEAKLKIARQEALIKKQSLQVEMELLQVEKDALIATAEYNGIRDEMDDDSDLEPNPSPILQRFVKDQQLGIINSQCETLQRPCVNRIQSVQEEVGPNFNEPYEQRQTENFISYDNRSNINISDTTIPAVIPATQSGQITDLSNFLIKRDLLFRCGIDNFDDRPDTYQAWKDSFCALCSEIKPNAREELEMLIKYLGPETKKHAMSIKCSNSSDPSTAVKKIWNRLETRYGNPVLVETTLKARLSNFREIMNKEPKRLFEFADLLSEIQSRMEDPLYRRSLSYFDSICGMKQIVAKLPYNLQDKWTSRAVNYNEKHCVTYPPFSMLVKFVDDMSDIKNNPGFNYVDYASASVKKESAQTSKGQIHVRKTEVDAGSNNGNYCMLHEGKHSLNVCKTFQKLTLNERKNLLRDYKFCFKCCESTAHNLKSCPIGIRCKICNRDNHCTALHVDKSNFASSRVSKEYGGESPIVSSCTSVCGDFNGRSCAKTVLVKVYPIGQPDKYIQTYALLDDQSNSTLAGAEFFDRMKIHWSTATSYSLVSCSGRQSFTGRRASNFIVESMDGACLQLPVITECHDIPSERTEIPTPEITHFHRHLQDVAIPPLHKEAPVSLLIGRDLPEAHHIYDQRIGPKGTPFAQKTILGWVIVGNVCLDKVHPPNRLTVLKTTIQKGHNSIFQDCEMNIMLEDDYIFRRHPNDNDVSFSIEDRKFLNLMQQQFTKDATGHWMAPLPFRETRPLLPDNRRDTLQRALNLQTSFKKNPVKFEHFKTFMKGIVDNGYAEVAPSLENTSEKWYLPIFGVYHPKKKDKIRVVFDSSAKHNGVSLNDVLMQGPDLLNRLDGVLLRFRRGPVAVIADIQQMFFNFLVTDSHRDYLRFFWYKDHDLNQRLIEHRMRVHVFGNSPSPAVATYGLRRCVQDDQHPCEEDVKDFVTKNFYVDDGLSSFPDAETAVDVVKRTQQVLKDSGNLRLHKIASNSDKVMQQFPSSDLAETIEPLRLDKDDLPIHHSLGMVWDLSKDTFTYKPSTELKPFTKRGLLSTVNGLFDPLGFIAPVVIGGKIILRETLSLGNWDDPLPQHIHRSWTDWLDSLKELDQIHIPRCFAPILDSSADSKTVHIFCDASTLAISACAYMRKTTSQGHINVGFVCGKSKIAPKSGHTIPRLELCSCVLAVELGETIAKELDIPLQNISYYSDSNVALGYISNERRRFYVYVSNRVARIRKSSEPKQWSHVPTDLNPADQGTRGLLPNQLTDSLWLKGPDFLYKTGPKKDVKSFPLIEPDTDKEICPEISTLKTTKSQTLGSSRFSRFSTWRSLVRSIHKLRSWLRSKFKNCEPLSMSDVETFIIKEIQTEYLSMERTALTQSKQIPSNSSFLKLSPFMDGEGLLRVGGRAKHAKISFREKMPILIPGDCYIAKLLVYHCHERVQHQGRHFTEGSVRSEGFWITGGKRLVANVIHHCVTCRKLRGKMTIQKMADLPEDRLRPSLPFTHVGVDVFGHWEIITRRTRGGSANSKRWAVLFTCLYSRAVHIELIEEMSTSSFINAMRRFIAIRGKVSEFRSDRGTNFVGAVSDLGINAINVEDSHVKTFLEKNAINWRFNPPHSSHFGGVWERMIGIARRILDAMFLDLKGKSLTHEVLETLMAEVSAIINSRPIVPVSSDADMPFILSPATLLTQKSSSIETQFKDIGVKDMYRSQWKMVQLLANTFWKRWKAEFLSLLQPRQKWTSCTENLMSGDVVLLRDKETVRHDWPVGLVLRVFPSDDGLVRKLEIRVIREGKPCIYIRPVSEVVPLISV